MAEEREAGTTIKMVRHNSQLLAELKKDVEKETQEERERTFPWIDEYDVNLWTFRAQHPSAMLSFENELDLSQWEGIAEHLGLTYYQIERCRRSERVTRAIFSTLEQYPQFRHLTVKDILKIFLQHNRKDILLKLEKYMCLRESVAVPEPERCATNTFTLSIQREPEVLVAASNLGCGGGGSPAGGDSGGGSGRGGGKQGEFRVKVLLFHAHDAREDALKLASQLRSGVGGRRLYVLLLQESENIEVQNSLRSDPWNSIQKWFSKFDAVVPVLSPQLLLQIQNRDLSEENNLAWEKRYNRFVYFMTLDQFVECGAKNQFCRAVCPARFLREMAQNDLVKLSGLFKYHWNCSLEGEVRECANILYEGAKEWRKMKKKTHHMRKQS